MTRDPHHTLTSTELTQNDPVPSPADFDESPVARIFRQPTMLGLFLPLNAGGWSASHLPRTTSWDFGYNRNLVRIADELGFDIVFGLSQWLPKGGFGEVLNGTSLDPFVTMAALATETKNILLASTVHILYGPWHPLHLARAGATLDHITNGRWGLNVVTGHRRIEHEMFGGSQIEHDQRYRLADEFVNALKALWRSDEPVTFSGKSPWRIKEGFITPKPRFGRPLLISATGSPAGIDFAARQSDIVFVTSPGGGSFEAARASLGAHTATVKAAAARNGRTIRVILNPIIVCRDTDQEAQEYYGAIVAAVEQRNVGGLHNIADTKDFDKRLVSDAQAWAKSNDVNSVDAIAVGGNVRLVGSPQRIVEQLAALHAEGVDGFHISFFDYLPDLTHFGRTVLPLMRAAGLRL
ncbi:LLM class flavin-dependent oxidoreductase [Agrobacterium rhizogenes]|uniref:LLM class flavin-dependent oxidoreductase n=13 Tax=Rhizobium/Agrobacterium group TaxID=227290 RepID=A0A2Z2PKF8_AGRFC|nr:MULTISPECIES: LLM class flavin-dependent oxidoreductase [Rhizobium/Agrobacterium group]ACM31082.1 conserved hypothetical protein [Rhizobium rhizogenes K84]AYD04984.1 hypothetical protein NCHU2750_56160 [Neorhizobium sp. NCHU2750]KJF70729.1 luciferase [Agrobacterium arsenijevicii]MCF1501059.1 LLM class flavin-dependent oxidoreductase [Allorhizobium sp. Av2]OCJ08319.1 luciferase [Agrobacterium sp. B131/95]OCJ28640.1 luciferase [Agrobacterium sp. B133/95]